ncbi:Transmembrane protein [Quillaja saponaria]|uniref:Transmembrane protein n=1 Tax=Quillaja saponaria TaxID=32244 RepID=A0AAD7KY45_QUISA|nr:Transmembrane protein [Quillaja saponaria]
MDAGVARDKGSPPLKPSKFSVYQNPALSSVLTANSFQPSKSTFLWIFSFLSASAFAFLTTIFRESGFMDILRLNNLSQVTAYWFAKTLQTLVGLVFLGTIVAFLKAIFLHKARKIAGAPVTSPSKENKDRTFLTNRQLGLLGIKTKVDRVASESLKKPPKSRPHLTSSPSDVLVPLHQPIPSSNRSSRFDADNSNSSGGGKVLSVSTPTKSPGSSSSLYLVPGVVSPLPSVQKSSGMDSGVSTPWSNKRSSYASKISSEEKLEKFLAEVDEKIIESAGKLSTPSPTISGFGIVSPNTVASSANASGTTRSTPLRPVRMSPGSQKFSTPPKKGEGDLPQPMSMEESIEGFEHLGIYPQIEEWRDRLRQWFSSVLLNPLLDKIETSHIQVMQTAAALGVSVTINQVGSDMPAAGTTPTVSAIDKTNDWQPAFTLKEDGFLHQLHAVLVQAIEASTSKLPVINQQQSPQQNPLFLIMQDCVNAITEHQRLQDLMKGEWVNGLLPQSSVRAEYTVQRIRELAEGTCVKNYEYLGSGEVYDKKNKKWTLELPSDSHLLLYLFCAYLEHPKWMLHVDATSYAGAQSSKNPLLLGILPPKERFPEKYITVVSSVPSVLHPGACILVVGRQSPPIFALYWDKKLQFSLQGRTALWDSVLLLCHRIKVGYGGIIRGMHLGSSALSILPVLETETED